MTDETTAEQRRQELKDVEEELAELRRIGGDAQARRGQDSDASEGYIEPEEIATELTGIAENEAIIDTLEQRRDRVQAKLDALGGEPAAAARSSDRQQAVDQPVDVRGAERSPPEQDADVHRGEDV